MSGGIPILRPVEPAALRNTWALIRDRIAGLAERFNEPWIADDVFHELLVANAHLWVTDELEGVLVLRIFATDYERVLFIWAAHSLGGDAKVADYLPQMVAIAAANSCDRIKWESPRKFHRALPGVEARYSYSIEVGGQSE